MECLAIDWSGALSGAAAKLWIASAVGGSLTSLTAPGSRDAVLDALLARRAVTAPCVVGLDFAFSVPQWFASSRSWSDVRDVWVAARDDGETWLRNCPAPFWGRAGVPRAHEAQCGLRETERTWTSWPRPKSVFQIGGAGAVGTGSIRGMPMLLALRDAGWAVWPFDAPSTHTLVEIYPRLFTGPVVKRDATARAAFLIRNYVTDAREFAAAMIESEDAFDAGVSAVRMSEVIHTAPLPTVSDPVSRIEGRIFVPDVTQRPATTLIEIGAETSSGPIT